MKKLLLTLTLLTLTGCTNVLVKNYGGKEERTLPCGQKLVNLTWKDANLWILTRGMREGEALDTYTFKEDSVYGVLQGTITIHECKSK